MVFLPIHGLLQAVSRPVFGHAFISEKHLWLLSIIYPEAFPTFSTQIYQTEIPLWILFTPSRQRLCSLEPSVPKRRINRRGGQTDIRLQGKKEVLKSRRQRSWAAHLVADGLVLEPRLVQDLLQLLVVEVGYPDGLGQPCLLTLLQGLGGRGGKQSWTVTWNGQ